MTTTRIIVLGAIVFIHFEWKAASLLETLTMLEFTLQFGTKHIICTTFPSNKMITSLKRVSCYHYRQFTTAVADSMLIFNISTERMDRKMLPCRRRNCTRNNKIKSTACRRMALERCGREFKPESNFLISKSCCHCHC